MRLTKAARGPSGRSGLRAVVTTDRHRPPPIESHQVDLMRVASPAVLYLALYLLPSATACNRAELMPEPPFTLKADGPNAWAAIENRKSRAPSSANAGFVIGEDSVAVIDTFARREAARQLLAEVHRVTKLPVKYVINTHHHPDHVSGNGREPGRPSRHPWARRCRRLDSLGNFERHDDRRCGRTSHRRNGPP